MAVEVNLIRFQGSKFMRNFHSVCGSRDSSLSDGCLLFQVAGLKYGAKYNYKVLAENAAGVSDPSNIIGPLLADDPHGETGHVSILFPSDEDS